MVRVRGSIRVRVRVRVYLKEEFSIKTRQGKTRHKKTGQHMARQHRARQHDTRRMSYLGLKLHHGNDCNRN